MRDLDPSGLGYFIPVDVGSLNADKNLVDFKGGRCFQDITFSYEQTGSDEDIGDVTITVDTEDSRSMFCKDWFFFATTEFYHVETFFFKGKHQIQFKNLSPEAKADIRKSGIKVYMFCEGYIETFISVLNSAMAFLGGLGKNPYLPLVGSHVPEYMI